MNVYLFVVLIVIVAPISVIIHELGHLLASYTVRASKLTLVVGSGKVRWIIKRKGITIQICTLFFISGSAMSFRQTPLGRFEKIWITMCGPLASMLFASMCFLLYAIYGSNVLLLFIIYNSWLGLVNLIPYKINGKCSDGYVILSTILKKHN